jgi:hypothetical protein
MKKRTVLLGDYDTATNGWTLGKWTLTDPEQKTQYVEKSGGDGSWDLSTALTDGIPRYKNRTLTIPLECSEGTREDREEIINEMVNTLDGLEWRIVLPDRPEHYLAGRLHVAVNYNDLAHAMVTVTGVVEPWFYETRETIVVLNAPITSSTDAATFTLWNHGRKVVTPVLDVVGTARLTFKGLQQNIEKSGSYTWPALQLMPGENELIYTGSYGATGETLTLTYREAVLR